MQALIRTANIRTRTPSTSFRRWGSIAYAEVRYLRSRPTVCGLTMKASASQETIMSVATVDRRSPSVFEADLPTLSYERGARLPTTPTGDIGGRCEQGRSRWAPHGPEVLGYELVRTTLRDHRLCPPPGLGLEAQGITSGPLWDRVTTTPAQHQRRRPCAAASTGVEGLHPARGRPARHARSPTSSTS